MQPFKVVVKLESYGPDGVLNQEVVVNEYSDDVAIHVHKNLVIGKYVTDAVNAAMSALVEDAKAVNFGKPGNPNKP